VDAIVEPPLPTDGFETQCPIPLLPSLPGCEWTPERLAVVPYLFADDEAVKRWAPAFADRSTVHIGLHWRAVGSNVLGRQRSLSLSGLAPLLGTPRARFYSLQYNGGDELKAYPEVVDLGHVDHPGERFVETAAVMQHLDLLIACDSGPAHVAGALGTKVWLLLHLPWSVRWGLHPETVWYPGHTCWQQTTYGGWEELVGDVRDSLKGSWSRRWPSAAL
jgi:hypothetical protein